MSQGFDHAPIYSRLGGWIKYVSESQIRRLGHLSHVKIQFNDLWFKTSHLSCQALTVLHKLELGWLLYSKHFFKFFYWVYRSIINALVVAALVEWRVWGWTLTQQKVVWPAKHQVTPSDKCSRAGWLKIREHRLHEKHHSAIVSDLEENKSTSVTVGIFQKIQKSQWQMNKTKQAILGDIWLAGQVHFKTPA